MAKEASVMKRKENSKAVDLLEVLISGVKPALGCTEPVALGLAVSNAYEMIKGSIEKIDIKVSTNVYKNGMGVGIPGTNKIGLDFAAALGITCGNPNMELEVFNEVNDKYVKEAEKLLSRKIISFSIEDNIDKLYIEANITTDQGRGICIIKGGHTNIVYKEVNGKVIFEKKEEKEDENGKCNLQDVTLIEIREFIENVPYKDIKFMLEGVELNMNIAKYGLQNQSGPGLGAAIYKMISQGAIKEDLVSKSRALSAAASDARMAGVNMPVMSSAGSGNHGITAIIPLVVVCEDLACDEEKLSRTLAFSHLTTGFIKSFIGPLSPVCGCAVAAGIGASAGITWALGGNDKQIAGAIKNMIGVLTGMVCDGAKGGCAFKLSTASAEAVIQAKLAMENVFINDTDGIVSPSVEETIRNLGRFSNEGMNNADNIILDIMMEKK